MCFYVFTNPIIIIIIRFDLFLGFRRLVIFLCPHLSLSLSSLLLLLTLLLLLSIIVVINIRNIGRIIAKIRIFFKIRNISRVFTSYSTIIVAVTVIIVLLRLLVK